MKTGTGAEDLGVQNSQITICCQNKSYEILIHNNHIRAVERTPPPKCELYPCHLFWNTLERQGRCIHKPTVVGGANMCTTISKRIWTFPLSSGYLIPVCSV